MEGSDAHVVDRLDHPRVTPVRPDERCSPSFARAEAVEHAVRANAALFRTLERSDRSRYCRGRRGADRGVLLLQQLLRFRRPRHDFGIEADPLGFEGLPPSSGADRRLEANKHFGFERTPLKEAAAGSRVADPDLTL